MSEQPPHQLSLDAVVRGCRDESQRERRHERGFCFELFRRALEDRDQGAWAALDQQYRRLMLTWIYAGSASDLAQEEAEDLAHEALEKFWRTLTSRDVRIAGRFEHVGALLRYLNQCAITTILDHRRRLRRRDRLIARLQAMHAAAPLPPPPAEAALDELCRQERLQRVKTWVRDSVTDAQERRVLSLSFEHDLSPAAIAERYPDEFPTVQLVRQIKERVLKRARRALDTPPEEK
jgi:RNA polymerase sigma factor (sigma-70 family)